MDDFISHNGINWRGDVGLVQYGPGDRNMVAIFYNRSTHNPGKSAETGKPVYEDKIFVKIHPPGERLSIIDRPATGDDRRRFPVQWAAFEQQQEQTPEGVPIDLLYPEQPAIAATLRAHAVHTIEQCAELSGVAIDNIGMGAQRYSNDAKKYLEHANKGVGAAQFRKEMDAKDAQIRVQAQQLAELQAEVRRLSAVSNTDTLKAMQAMLAGAQERPEMPAPGAPQSATFDAALAQINAVHESTTKPKRTRVK